MKQLAPLFVATAVWSGTAILPLNDPVDIREWPVPWQDTRPRDPYVDGQGRVWFVGQAGDYVAYLDARRGEFKRYELEPGTGPHNLIVDDDGFVWYSGNRARHIGKLDPKDGTITKFLMPNDAARDPHTLIFDQAGDIWFTVQGGNFVGKMTRASGEIHLIEVPTPRARPYGIVITSENRPFIAEFGSNKIATVDPTTMELREHVLPREGSRPRRIAVTSDDIIWYADYAQGFLGRLDPATGKVQEWATPGGSGARPYAMAADDHDRLWFVESGPDPNRLVGFDPRTQQFFSVTDIESGGGTVRHMVFHEPTRQIWFGTDANTIGRAQIP